MSQIMSVEECQSECDIALYEGKDCVAFQYTFVADPDPTLEEHACNLWIQTGTNDDDRNIAGDNTEADGDCHVLQKNMYYLIEQIAN